MYNAAGCGGCDISLLEIHEHLLELADAATILFWPAAMDFKYDDVRALEDDAIDVCFVNGAIRTEENVEIVGLLRAKARMLVSFGACASFGGVPGLANMSSTASLVARVYSTDSTDAEGIRPTQRTAHASGGVTELTPLTRTVASLLDTVAVDYVLPGCPPAASRIWEVCQAIVSGTLPDAPAVVGAATKCVCDECSLPKQGTRVARFVRPHEIIAQAGRCLLEQGIVCSGPATRSGCGAQCTSALMPCRGCYGPAGDSIDTGAAMIAALGTVVDSDDPDKVAAAMATIVDPAGTFYCYTLPSSILGGARSATDESVPVSPAEGVAT
jgi:F420-non-reducing hydrogenase small subunit